MTKINSDRTLVLTIAYAALSFFVLGAAAMIHFFIYPTFDKVHEQIASFMELFNGRTILLFDIPMTLLLFTSIAMCWFAPKNFPTWIIGISIVLTGIALVTTIFVLHPIQNSFSVSGFKTIKYNQLLSYSFTLQLIPLALQAILALLLLNKFFTGTKAKWIFILLFVLAFYTAGTDFIEKLLNYPLWLKVSDHEWLSFRQAAKSTALIWVYLIPAFLPFIILICMFWFRPAKIKKQSVLIYFGLYLLIVITTFTYFVPKLQMPLDKTYSNTLIEQLIKMDLPLRFVPGLITYVLATAMFLKLGKAAADKSTISPKNFTTHAGMPFS